MCDQCSVKRVCVCVYVRYCPFSIPTRSRFIHVQHVTAPTLIALRRRRRLRIAGAGRPFRLRSAFASQLLLFLHEFGALLRQDAADAQRTAALAEQRVLRIVRVDQPLGAVADFRVNDVADLVEWNSLVGEFGLRKKKRICM